MSPKIGRPKIENPKTERLYIRVTPEEKAQIYDFVQKADTHCWSFWKRGLNRPKNIKITQLPDVRVVLQFNRQSDVKKYYLD